MFGKKGERWCDGIDEQGNNYSGYVDPQLWEKARKLFEQDCRVGNNYGCTLNRYLELGGQFYKKPPK